MAHGRANDGRPTEARSNAERHTGARADDDGRETEGETKSGETQRGRESGEAPARKMTAEQTSRGQFEEPQRLGYRLGRPE